MLRIKNRPLVFPKRQTKKFYEETKFPPDTRYQIVSRANFLYLIQWLASCALWPCVLNTSYSKKISTTTFWTHFPTPHASEMTRKFNRINSDIRYPMGRNFRSSQYRIPTIEVWLDIFDVSSIEPFPFKTYRIDDNSNPKRIGCELCLRPDQSRSLMGIQYKIYGKLRYPRWRNTVGAEIQSDSIPFLYAMVNPKSNISEIKCIARTRMFPMWGISDEDFPRGRRRGSFWYGFNVVYIEQMRWALGQNLRLKMNRSNTEMTVLWGWVSETHWKYIFHL